MPVCHRGDQKKGASLEETVVRACPVEARDVTGVILAGGHSSRFGSNKALATFQGIPLIDRVVNVMSPLFSDLMVVTNRPDDYHRLHLTVVEDLEPYKGPLGGIYTALRAATNDFVFVVGCDMPLLKEDLIRQILSKRDEVDAVIPIANGRQETLMALYSRRLLPVFCRFLREDRLSLREFASQLDNVTWIPIEGNAAVSVNTPADLKQLEEDNAGGPI